MFTLLASALIMLWPRPLTSFRCISRWWWSLMLGVGKKRCLTSQNWRLVVGPSPSGQGLSGFLGSLPWWICMTWQWLCDGNSLRRLNFKSCWAKISEVFCVQKWPGEKAKASPVPLGWSLGSKEAQIRRLFNDLRAPCRHGKPEQMAPSPQNFLIWLRHTALSGED